MNESSNDDKVDLRSGGAPKVLVSACLVGRPVRYNGSSKTTAHPLLDKLREQGRLVIVCPELSAGFSIPRPSAEVSNANDGRAVLKGDAEVIEATGSDVTDLYIEGARTALALATQNGCRFALLLDGSPSCGSKFIYDGTFSGRKQAGEGVTAALLRQNGIEVFSENEIEDLGRRLEGQ